MEICYKLSVTHPKTKKRKLKKKINELQENQIPIRAWLAECRNNHRGWVQWSSAGPTEDHKIRIPLSENY